MKTLALAWTCLLLAIPCSATTITVNWDGSGDFTTIQAAISNANDGDTVLVADGIYTGDGNRDIDFLGKAITVKSTNGPENCIIDPNGTETEPHRGFYFHTGEEQDSVLDGFTITNGCTGEGGGIMCWDSSPTITNNIITHNRTSFDADGGAGIKCRGGSPTIKNNTISHNSCPPGGGGGGIRCYEADSPTITDNIISHNTASQGAGMLIDFCTPTISNCTFTANSTDGMGGGILIDSNAVLVNCIFSGNTAVRGAGMYVYHSDPTLLNCSFTGNSADFAGGGMYNSSSNPTVTGCSFTRNFAWDGEGAGIYNSNNSSPTVTGCTFINNWSEGGSGISNYWYSDPNVTDCTFTENGVEGPGGGMFNWQYCSPTVTNCTFIGNSANRGGGMCNDDNCNPTVTGCIFTDNWAYTGGGMCNDDNCEPTVTDCSFGGNFASGNGGGMNNRSSSPTVANCTFSGNLADGDEYVEDWGYGGGMYNWGSRPDVTNCIFTGNGAWRGGGLYNINGSPVITNCTFVGNSGHYGSGMGNEQHSSPIVTNCIFTGNSGVWSGGGMYNIYDSSPTVTNCTFSGNSAEIGGGMYNWESSPIVTNCILWGDTAFFENEICNHHYSTPVISYSDIASCLLGGAWDNDLGSDGGGNIDVDPLFIDADGADNTPGTEDDNLRLQADSSCIDSGDNSVVDANIPDLDGNERIVNGIVDMGAYEALGPIEADVHIVPRVINRRNRMKKVLAIIRLPEDIHKADVSDEPFELYAADLDGEPIEAVWQRVIGWRKRASVFAVFDKAELMNALEQNGRVELTVVGKLESGQYIQGSDTIRIIRRGRGPREQTGLREGTRFRRNQVQNSR